MVSLLISPSKSGSPTNSTGIAAIWFTAIISLGFANCSATGFVTPEKQGNLPDLVVASLSANERNPAAGAQFTVAATVANQGDETAAATTLRYYRSPDANITPADTEVGMEAVAALAAAASSSHSLEVTAPASPGRYYYGACVVPVTDESDTTNNCSPSVQVTVPQSGHPDLMVLSPSVRDGNPSAGTQFTLAATVTNQGDGTAPATTLRYHRSPDANITPTDTEVGMEAVAALAAAASSSHSLEVTAPASPGRYYYGACVVPVTDESDTTNNCSPSVQVTVPQSGRPDLVVASPSVSPSDPSPEAQFTLAATVTNQGDGPAAVTILRYYRSPDANITPADTEVDTVAIAALAAAASSSQSVSLTAPASSGRYYYGACVVPVTDESDTTNNCSPSVQVTVPQSGRPDLVVLSPSVSDGNPSAGGQFTLSVMVRNDGDGDAPATTLRYSRSPDAAITTSDPVLRMDTVPPLPAAASSARSAELSAPATPGTYYYGACVDPLAEESDTTNNCSPSVSVTIAEAPPISSSPSISIELSPDHQVPKNTAITATITLHNLDAASYSSVIFRADVTVYARGEARCYGDDTGRDLEIPVDGSREVFTVSVYDACPHDTYGNYTHTAMIFDADDRTELASTTTYFLMSRYLKPGESSPAPPAPGVQAWLDPAPPPIMYVGEWYRVQVRADVRLYHSDHVGVHGYGSEPYLLTSRSESTPSESVADACLNPHSDVVHWRRALHQAMHLAACKPGTATVLVRHETAAVASLYTYEIEVRER